jgi:GNAT superfamily N-acetyltransferase
MKIRYIRLIEEKKEELWNRLKDFTKIFGQSGNDPLGHLAYIKERHGEKIVAVGSSTEEVLGWIAVFPDRGEGGLHYRLAGLEVSTDHRGQGIGIGLLEEARKLVEAQKSHRLRFGTSPLLTRCAALYVTRFGTRYRWKPGVKGPDGKPWPYVSCECDFDDPLFKPLDLRDDEVEGRSVLSWEGETPAPRKGITYSGPLSVVLPALGTVELTAAMENVPGFLPTMYAVFESLHARGYGFAWFDRISLHGAPWYYYVMKKVMSL